MNRYFIIAFVLFLGAAEVHAWEAATALQGVADEAKGADQAIARLMNDATVQGHLWTLYERLQKGDFPVTKRGRVAKVHTEEWIPSASASLRPYGDEGWERYEVFFESELYGRSWSERPWRKMGVRIAGHADGRLDVFLGEFPSRWYGKWEYSSNLYRGHTADKFLPPTLLGMQFDVYSAAMLHHKPIEYLRAQGEMMRAVFALTRTERESLVNTGEVITKDDHIIAQNGREIRYQLKPTAFAQRFASDAMRLSLVGWSAMPLAAGRRPNAIIPWGIRVHQHHSN